MHAERFTVKYTSVQNCFVYLPDTWYRRYSAKKNVVKVNHDDRWFYFSSQPQPGSDGFFKLSATFAGALGIGEGDDVEVTEESYPPSVGGVVVVPNSKEDWEIVELQSNRIQESLLNQVNVVAVNQNIVVWISKYLSVVLKVESLEPGYRCGILEPFTEVTVSLPRAEKGNDNEKFEKDNDNRDGGENGAWNMVKNFLPKLFLSSGNDGKESRGERIEEESLNSLILRYSKDRYFDNFRFLPLKKAAKSERGNLFLNSILGEAYVVFIRRRFLPATEGGEIYCRLKKVRDNLQFVKLSSTNYLRNEDSLNFTKELIARVYVIEDIEKLFSSRDFYSEYFADNSVHRSLYASENLMINLKLKIGDRLTFKVIDETAKPITSIEIYPENDILSLNDFINYVKISTEYKKLILNNSSRLILSDKKSCVVKIYPIESSHVILDSYDLNNVKIYIKEPIKRLDNEMDDMKVQETISLKRISTKGLDSLLSECKSTLSLSLGLDRNLSFEYDRENILICGKLGSGKTTISQLLKIFFQGIPHFVYTHSIDCKSLKGKKVETLQKIFLPAVLDCVHRQPSVLVIDDLEIIACQNSEEEENTPDGLNRARTADMLFNLIREYQASHYFAVVATSTSVNKISEKLAAPRGTHFFRSILTIPESEKEERIEILRLNLNDKLNLSNEIDWNDYGNKTEGWTAQDLTNFSQKALFTCWKRHVNGGGNGSPILEEADLAESLEKSTPASLQGLDLYSGPGNWWSDIGGLAEVKKSLIELLNWPLKYPELFKNAPIKHQGGVLLYGAPGTGKTMLAGAIAKECGLNFISVKGPELLSKYIGASEEAVRNVFEKANTAKPCVLFFDEFDSLAPRRGHDSTGVTDRVVNQFLAQLDGVEGRQGVAVVAASSRPDLLDPALLRPGRLDKALLCEIPNEHEREEILSALLKNVNISSMDLKKISEQTSGFTGADLSALISQAKLLAIEEGLNAVSESRKSQREENDDCKIDDSSENFISYSTTSGVLGIMTQEHLEAALNSTRPSLSTNERRKYEIIYSKFSRSGTEISKYGADNNDNGNFTDRNRQRATLA